MVADRIRDANIWWLFSELARRGPIRLRGAGPDPSRPGVFNTQSGGGALLVLDHGSVESAIVESLMSSERAIDAVKRWADQVHVHFEAVGPDSPRVLTYRVLAEVLQRHVMSASRVTVQWAPPVLEYLSMTDGFSEGLVDSSWGPFASAKDHIQKRLYESHMAPLLEVQEICWLVSVNGNPALLVDEGAWVHDVLGNHANLASAFSASHSTGAVYERHFRAALQPSD